MNADLAELQVAAAAADAARATPGVERLQPGLWGLVQQVGHEMWVRATGEPYPDVGGVEVELVASGFRLDVTIVADGSRPAADIAFAVQRAVAGAVGGVTVAEVAVHVCEISLPH